MAELSKRRLAAIRGRLNAATPWPWHTGSDGLVWADRLGDPVSASTELEDAQFIAAAPRDIAALLAEVERLRRKRWPQVAAATFWILLAASFLVLAWSLV